MKHTILFTASLLSLTFVGRAMFDTNSKNDIADATQAPQKINLVQTKISDKPSLLEEYGGGFIIKLTLAPQADGWTVIRTEELGGTKPSEKILKDFENGFSKVDSTTWTSIMPPVREYLYHRKAAVVSQDGDKLWKRYPELKQKIQKADGNDFVQINTLPWTFKNSQLKPIDGNIDAEAGGEIKTKNDGDKVQVIVRGMETYQYWHGK
jgi:hypothetical protein